MPSHSPAAIESADEEYTVDELAAQVGMTVRNVRAYASRGILPPPRLEGRTGYYGRHHVQRLRLARELLDRGLTLSAVEGALRTTHPASAGHTLDLLHILDRPQDVEPEVMTRDALAALAGVARDDEVIGALEQYQLVRTLDNDTVELLNPHIVRIGLTAMSLGLKPSSIIDLYPVMRSHLRVVADSFVSSVVRQIIDPFISSGMPEDDWPRILSIIEELLPVASQITVAVLQAQLGEAIESEIHSQLKSFPRSDDTDD